MKFRWFGHCASCEAELAVKPKYGPEKPGGSLLGGVQCDSCHGPTPILYTGLSIIIKK